MWTYKRTITIDHTKVGSSTHTNFPVLVAGTYAYLATTANGGEVEHASGYDIAFFSDSDCTQMLDFERVHWDATTGEIQFYVRVPSLSHVSDTVIYLGYKNSSISTDQQDITGTWNSNFKGVWHMEGNSNDSSPSNHDGSDTNVTYNTANGKHQKGAGFASASSSKVNIGTSADYDAGALTVFAWVNSSAFPNAFNGIIGKDNTVTPYWSLLSKSDGKLAFFVYTTGDIFVNGGSGAMSTDTWYRVCAKYGTTNGLKMYLNGTQDGSASASGSQAAVTGRDLVIGASNLAGRFSDSKMDEVMYLATEVSADWVTADYNNQNSPSTFYAVGDQETVNDPPATPTNSSPADEATGVDRNPTLSASTFSDPESDDHYSSQWQVATDSGFSSVVWDSGEEVGSNLTSITVNTTNGTFSGALSGKIRLSVSTEYYFRVRYKDDVSLTFSSYSTPTSFTIRDAIVTPNSYLVNHLAKYPIKISKYSMVRAYEAIPSESLPDGVLALDLENNRLYARSNGVWKYASLT